MFNLHDKRIAIVGGGIAGMQIASVLGKMGYSVTLLEKKEALGGNVAGWSHLFPYNEEASEIVAQLKASLVGYSNIEIRYGEPVTEIKNNGNKVSLTTPNAILDADAAIIATGFEPFDATRKEEYGYGVFDRVITSVDFEKYATQKPISDYLRQTSGTYGFVHCVGSRDEKVCNEYCSKVCCITAIKQAIELKKRNPEARVYCFYMDLRLFDRNFEKQYRTAQEEYGIQFIRGRLSEVSEDIDGKVVVRVEDTLSHRPMKLSLDMLVLMVGMTPSEGTANLGKQLGMVSDDDHFIAEDTNVLVAQSKGIREGIFVAGTAKGPLTIKETLADAKSMAINAHFYLKQLYQ